MAVEMHRAGAAQARAAPIFGAGHFQMLAHHPKQRRIGLCLYADRLAVDREADRRHASLPEMIRVIAVARFTSGVSGPVICGSGRRQPLPWHALIALPVPNVGGARWRSIGSVPV